MEGMNTPLEELNDTELWDLARMQMSAAWRRAIRFSRSVPRERIIMYIETGVPPHPDDVLLESRFRLQQWVDKNWVMVNSQLPCAGALRGKCTIYPCAEGRHLSCYEKARPHFQL
jgi:hypothetical protein